MVDFGKLKSEFGNLKKSGELKGYLNAHDGAYLVSAFLISDYDIKDAVPWVFEYYWPEDGKVVTFSFDGGWRVTGEDNVLQKEKKVLEELDFEGVNFFDPIGNVEEALEEEYSMESPMKMIVILNSQDRDLIWSITVFTRSLKIINFRIDAVSGETKSSMADDLLQFQKSSQA